MCIGLSKPLFCWCKNVLFFFSISVCCNSVDIGFLCCCFFLFLCSFFKTFLHYKVLIICSILTLCNMQSAQIYLISIFFQNFTACVLRNNSFKIFGLYAHRLLICCHSLRFHRIHRTMYRFYLNVTVGGYSSLSHTLRLSVLSNIKYLIVLSLDVNYNLVWPEK